MRRDNAIAEEPAPEPVFTVPFELNETQVRFVANEAVFIDEEAAKAILAPVAEKILAHPDHPILLAGTTARWGDQASCVDLSDRRAAAVKDLLVSGFGVPEKQLVSVGLGYEDEPSQNIGLKLLRGIASDITYLNALSLNNLTIKLQPKSIGKE